MGTRKTNCKNQIIGKEYLKTSYNKTKGTAFWGKYLVRLNIVIKNKILEQVQYSSYLGSYITFNEGKDFILN